MSWLSWLVPLALAGPPPALAEVEPRPPTLPSPRWSALEGGAEVVVLERPELPLQRVELWVAWEGAQAPLGEQLAADLVGEALRGGTRLRSGAELAGAMDALGAVWDVGMDPSHLWAWVEVPAPGVAQAVALLGEAVTRSAYLRGPVRRERARWVAWLEDLPWELRQLHRRAENHAWFPATHPSRQDVRAQDLRALPPGRVQALVERTLAQGRARVLAAGAVPTEVLLPSLEAAWGRLRGTQEATPAPQVKPRRALWLVSRGGFDAALVSVMTPGLPHTDPRAAQADLLVELLAAGFTSRLSQDLREARGLTYGVYGEHNQSPQAGQVLVHLEAPTERAVEALLAIHTHLDRLVEGGVGALELRRARSTLLFAAAQRFLSNAGALAWLGEWVPWGLDPMQEAAHGEALARSTPAELDALARALFAPERRVSVLTGDREVLEDALLEAGQVPDRILSAKALVAQP